MGQQTTKKLGRTDLAVSRLGFGTAEIGFAYGIGPRTLPSETEAITLLQTAVENGITFFDTANYYGLAEERIGRSGIIANPAVVVETKCAKFLENGEYFPRPELEQKIRDEVSSSLSKLDVAALSVLMLHGPSKEQIENGELIDIVNALKREGKIKFAGVSTRGEEAPLAAIASGAFDVIQIAYSILDQRMAKKVLPAAKKKNIGVVNRSVLLKGALTPLVSHLPSALDPLKNNSNKALAVAQGLGIGLPELALRFTLSEETIATSLIGTNSVTHLKAAIDGLMRGVLPDDAVRVLRKLALDDPLQVDPARWPKS